VNRRWTISLVAVAMLGVACEDEGEELEEEIDSLGRIELVSHEYDCDPDWGECGYDDGGNRYYNGRRSRGGNDNRGGRNVSPGPFDDSPIRMENVCISLDCSGRERGEEPPPEEEMP